MSAETAELRVWAEGEIRSTRRDLDRHERLLVGDGKTGVLASTAETKEAVMQVQAIVRDMRKTQEQMFTRMEKSAARSEAHAEAMAARVKALEVVVSPLLNWKRGIILRLTTMSATALGVIGAAWWLYDNLDKVRAAFRWLLGVQ